MGGLCKIKAGSLGTHEILDGVFKTLLDEDYFVTFSGLTTVNFQRRPKKDNIEISVFRTTTHLVFGWKANKLKASEARGR